MTVCDSPHSVRGHDRPEICLFQTIKWVFGTSGRDLCSAWPWRILPGTGVILGFLVHLATKPSGPGVFFVGRCFHESLDFSNG
jgi:hypothetical protein